LNTELKGRHSRSRWEQQVRKVSCRKKEENGKKLRKKSFGKKETDGENWLLDDSRKNFTSQE
jgi:hypothetical protein